MSPLPKGCVLLFEYKKNCTAVIQYHSKISRQNRTTSYIADGNPNAALQARHQSCAHLGGYGLCFALIKYI